MRPDARCMKHLGSPHQIGHQIRPKAWPPKWSVFGKDRSQLPNDIATWTPKPNTDVRPGPGAYNLNRQSKWKATSRSGCTWGRRWLGCVSFVFYLCHFSKLFLSIFSSIVNQPDLVNWRLHFCCLCIWTWSKLKLQQSVVFFLRLPNLHPEVRAYITQTSGARMKYGDWMRYRPEAGWWDRP